VQRVDTVRESISKVQVTLQSWCAEGAKLPRESRAIVRLRQCGVRAEFVRSGEAITNPSGCLGGNEPHRIGTLGSCFILTLWITCRVKLGTGLVFF
jgi:hypothetical protein